MNNSKTSHKTVTCWTNKHRYSDDFVQRKPVSSDGPMTNTIKSYKQNNNTLVCYSLRKEDFIHHLPKQEKIIIKKSALSIIWCNNLR